MPIALISYISMGLQMIPTLIAAGQSVAGLVTLLQGALTQKSDPTDAQWAALDKHMQDALAALDAASK